MADLSMFMGDRSIKLLGVDKLIIEEPHLAGCDRFRLIMSVAAYGCLWYTGVNTDSAGSRYDCRFNTLND